MYNEPILKSIKIYKVDFGKNVEIIEPCNLYECKLGNNVFVGPFTEIQKNVEIGNNTRIQSHCFICELVIIRNDCFIGHGVNFINDRFRGGKPNYLSLESTAIGNNVSIGSGSTILPVFICNNVVIGAGSVVTKNIMMPGIYVGNPAKLIRKFENEDSRK